MKRIFVFVSQCFGFTIYSHEIYVFPDTIQWDPAFKKCILRKRESEIFLKSHFIKKC